MGTPQTLVVLAALMALISLVGIGIDWIGKPLRNRHFVPRIYRYDDEKLPVDAHGRTSLPVAGYATPPPVSPRPVAYVNMPAGAAAPALGTAAGFNTFGAGNSVPALPVVPSLPNVPAVPVIPSKLGAGLALGAAAAAAPSRPTSPSSRPSAFSDTVAPPATAVPKSPERDEVAGAEQSWRPGLPLDARVGDRKPTLADKAQRFWQTTASQSSGPTHFDTEDRVRMSTGKAPRRLNPRTGRSEAMQLGALRQASRESEVMMRWPDDSVDPWSAR